MESFLALDVGGTRIKWGLVQNGLVLREGTVPTQRGSEKLTETIISIVKEHNMPYGISLAGDIDRHGHMNECSNLGLVDYNPNAELAKAALTKPTICCNDAAAAAAGETGPGGNIVYVTVGAGVGAKLVIDGDVICGRGGAEGGHLVFEKDGRLCGCGRHGCVETYAGWFPLQQYSQKILTSPTDVLDDQHALDQALDAIAFVGSSLLSASDPGELVLGGGVSMAWNNVMVEGIQARLPDLSWAGRNTRVRLSSLDTQAAMLGLYYLGSGQMSLRYV